MSCSKAVSNDLDGWLINYEQALETASETNKVILINFTGSDWCPWCMRLAEEVFEQKEFLDYAEKNLVLLKIDFLRRTRQPREVSEYNQALAQRYNIQGFPTIVIIDKEENILLVTGYRQGGAADYVEHLEEGIRN